MGFFHVVEYIPRKFIVTSLSTSCRPPKERICFPAGKSFLSEQIPLGRIASSGEADRVSPNLSPQRSDDKIPLKSSDVSTFHKLSIDTTLSLNIVFSLVSNMYFVLTGLGNRCCIKITETAECLVGKNEILRLFLSCKKA